MPKKESSSQIRDRIIAAQNVFDQPNTSGWLDGLQNLYVTAMQYKNAGSLTADDFHAVCVNSARIQDKKWVSQ